MRTAGGGPKSILRAHIFDLFVNIKFYEILEMTVVPSNGRGEVFGHIDYMI